MLLILMLLFKMYISLKLLVLWKAKKLKRNQAKISLMNEY